MDNCIFCKIAKGEISSSKVYENEHIFAFMDINPVNKGHVLVIPKEHYENYLQIPNELLSEFSRAVKIVATGVKFGTNADGINITMNNGKAAGQVVFHAHFHIIPRFENDGFKNWPQKKYNENEIIDYQKKIISQINKI